MHFKIKLPIVAALLLQPLFFLQAGIYQAETANLYKAVTETKNSGYLGDSYINFDNETGSYLELSVGMAAAGDQSITIRYSNGTAIPRPMEIKLNGIVVAASYSFESTGAWTNWQTVNLNANFIMGVNVLRLTSLGSEGGPNIDQFEISGDPAVQYNLNLSVVGNGQIIRIPESALLFAGQEIMLIAKPSISSVFREWTGDKTGSNDTISFILDGNKSIQANFDAINLQVPAPDFSMTGYASLSGEGVATTTGGKGGKITVIRTLAELIAWGLEREDNYTAETVIIKGKIEAETSEVVTIKRGKDISIIGDSDSEGGFAELKNISLNIRDYSNVIVRNLKMHEIFYPNDDLTIDECHHVWIDHCEFHSKIGPGIGVDTYDGLLDIKNGSHNVTVSWCYFHDHMKTVLIGHSDSNGTIDVNLQTTFHHNWFSNTDGRNPSLRFGQSHYFNNYLKNIADYGFAVRNGAHAKIENCHFESVNQPIVTDNFTGHGFACVSGCIYTGTCTENSNKILTPYDCEFWSTQIPYTYQLEEVSTVHLSVQMYAGVGIITTAGYLSVKEEYTPFYLNSLFYDRTSSNIRFSITMENPKAVSFSVYSADGKRVFLNTQNLNSGVQDIEIPVHGIRKGFYILSAETSEARITRKIIIGN